MAQNLRVPSITSKLSNVLNPRNIFTGLLGLINPAFGLLSKGLGYLGTKAQDLRGYNPDGSPRTQAQYEAARFDKQIQGRKEKRI